MKLQRTVFFLTTLLLSTSCLAAGEPFTKLNFVPAENDTWKTQTNGKEILLARKNEFSHLPEMWSGDLQIRDLKTGRLCSVNTRMVSEVYARTNGKVIVSITETGAGETFRFIDIDTCKDKHPSVVGYSKRPHIKNNTIVIEPKCEGSGLEKAFCSSANVYALDTQARPIWSEKESMARTIRVLGVGFKGERQVDISRTKSGVPFKKLTFVPVENDTWKTKTNGKEIFLTERRGTEESPGIWTGDLQIRDLKTGLLCKANDSVFGEVYARRNGKVIILVYKSGPGDYFNFINIDTCEYKYLFIRGFSGHTRLKNNIIIIDPDCSEAGPGKESCSSAEVYFLDADARPVWSEKESIARTKQVLGVGFEGERLVENPRTNHAKLLPEEPEEKREGWFSSIKNWFSP